MDKRDECVVEILTNQLPTYFRPIIEFQEIMKVHGYALEELRKAAVRMSDNFYIISCDGQTLTRYEALLGITKTSGLSLEERRAVVLAQYSMYFLYTLPALKEMLFLSVGANHYSVTCLYDKYQLIAKIIDKDLQIVKETYAMISLIKPAHIELLLFAEHQEEAKLEVGQAVTITFIMSFYPLFNLPKLRLNGKWKLNGKKKLSGYDGTGRIDLYPVGMEFKVPVREEVREAARLTIFTKAAEQVVSSQDVEIRTSATCQGEVKEEFTVQASAKAEMKAGNATLYNGYRLDGKLKLNGNLKLNGGHYQL